MFRFVALFAALALNFALSVPAMAQSRGLTVELRSAPEATAPVAERVELYDNSYALVIGNDAYSAGWPKLSNAVADATEIATALKEAGFEVTFKQDLDSVALRDSLREFFAIQGADPEARLLLWYAGHGHSIKDEGFLVPIDAPAPSEPEFKIRALQMRDFGSLMRLADAKHVLAIFDSCFSGTIFTTRAGAVPAAITQVTTKPTRQFMTSGDADQQVSDDGTFRRLFLQALVGETTADSNGDGYLTGTELGLFMSDEMANYSEGAQTPRYGKLRDPDYDRGDFVFALPGRIETTIDDFAAGATPGEPAAGAEQMIAEITLWTTVVVSQDPAMIQTYLDQYPTGRFAKAAIARIDELKKQIAEKEAADAAAAALAAAAGTSATPDGATVEATPGGETAVEGEAGTGIAADAGTDFMPAVEQTAAAANPVLELLGGVNLTEVGSDSESSWLPTVGETETDAFQLTAMRSLPEGFFGSGAAAEAVSGEDAAINRDFGPQGYSLDPSAWLFSDPQGDSQYKLENEWIHLRAPGNHNMWDCARGLAPILSVPAPAGDIWSAQVWFQLPARIGYSHVGLAVWNGVEADGPTHALYFGPADTSSMPVGGSYRSDCSAHTTDLSNRSDTTGRFNVEYAGGRGWLRVSRNVDTLTFYFKSPNAHNWRELGSMQVEGKDNLVRVGLFAKTWSTEPVVASFADFRIIPGHTGIENWTPDYYERLARDGVATFAGEQFSDFEWSDPAGDSVHEISGGEVRLKTSGNHNLWDCNRMTAPILSVDVPRLERWTAEVDFSLPARIQYSQVGMVLWNDEFEDAPVYQLVSGPAETDYLGVAGSNAIDCSSGGDDLRSQPGSSGDFGITYNRSSGRLRVARDGDKVSFYFKSPERRNWEHLGTTYASVRDDFSKIGLFAKTWGSEPVNATFSNFRIIADETEPDRWFPGYYAQLKTGEPITFTGEDFADFEWSDPDGNSVNEIRGPSIRLATTGGHNGVWDCLRNKAPILSVAVPPRDTWVAQVRYRLSNRADHTSAGLVLWNGAEFGQSKSIAIGPSTRAGLYVGGSYSDDCSANWNELPAQPGNSGTFGLSEGGDEGLLQIVKLGWLYRFSYYDPATGQWNELGTIESTVKDNFNRIGLTVTSWGTDPVEAEFRDFTLVPGMFR
ncbi:MAG: caspase family protein [Alphaproteobacteria bacterium]|nr:caspase family protein [Alphaproteobacteria bacterium]